MSALINIMKRERGLKIPAANAPLDFAQKNVSQWSKFLDPVWMLSTKDTIHWLRLPENQANVNRDEFNSLMAPVRQLAYLLIFEEELRPKTIYFTIQSIKMFACWMLSQKIPFTRYCDVSPSAINKYLDQLSRKPSRLRLARTGSHQVKPETLRTHARALLRLYQYKDRIGDGLQDFRILLDQTTIQEYERSPSRTEAIPDEELQQILRSAVKFVNETGMRTIRRLKQFVAKEKVIEVHEALVKVGKDDLSLRRLEKVTHLIEQALKPYSTREWDSSSTVSVAAIAQRTNCSLGDCAICLRQTRSLGDMYRRRRKEHGDSLHWDVGDLNLKIRLLQIACFIIIATSTGMRLGELLAIQPGCMVKRKVRGVFLYWVKSILSKTSPTHAGESAAWLCGELAAKAITTLQHLHTALPSNTESKVRSRISIQDSLFRTYVWDGVTLEARPVTCPLVLQKAMNLFIKELDLKVGYIHPHRFRRTFARNIVRWTETPILALQRHFKHWSLLMTDYYIGIDPQLMEMFFEAQMEASRVRLRQILSGECGGPGGFFCRNAWLRWLTWGNCLRVFTAGLGKGLSKLWLMR